MESKEQKFSLSISPEMSKKIDGLSKKRKALRENVNDSKDQLLKSMSNHTAACLELIKSYSLYTQALNDHDEVDKEFDRAIITSFQSSTVNYNNQINSLKDQIQLLNNQVSQLQEDQKKKLQVTNYQLGSANIQLGSANIQLEDDNVHQLSSDTTQLGSDTTQLGNTDSSKSSDVPEEVINALVNS